MMQSKMTVSEIAEDLGITRPKVYRALEVLNLTTSSLEIDSFAIAKIYSWLSPVYLHKSTDLLKRTLAEFKQVKRQRDEALQELWDIKNPPVPVDFDI